MMKNLFLWLMLVVLSSSFAEGPVTFNNAHGRESDSAGMPVGGAYLVFAGKFGGEVTKKDIESHRELKVEGCAWQATIISYSLTVVKGGQTSTYQAQSNLLTPEILTKLKSLSKGDSFAFSQVKADMPNGKDTIDVHTKKFTVV